MSFSVIGHRKKPPGIPMTTKRSVDMARLIGKDLNKNIAKLANEKKNRIFKKKTLDDFKNNLRLYHKNLETIRKSSLDRGKFHYYISRFLQSLKKNDLNIPKIKKILVDTFVPQKDYDILSKLGLVDKNKPIKPPKGLRKKIVKKKQS
ncbi:hypothetical protein ACFLZV_06150, partial [Candidatus Margulisiibacteriota bacterium]